MGKIEACLLYEIYLKRSRTPLKTGHQFHNLYLKISITQVTTNTPKELNYYEERLMVCM